MAITDIYSQNPYWKRPDESVPEYNARVAQYNISRDLNNIPSGGESAAGLLGPGNAAGVTPGQGSSQMFNQALINLLTKFQQPGTAPFLNAQLQGQQAQAQTILNQNVPAGMSPSMQNQILGAQSSIYTPMIQGAQQMGQTVSEQIAGLSNNLDKVLAVSQWMQQAEQTDQKNAQDIIFNHPNVAKAMGDKEKRALEKKAGLTSGIIDLMPKTATTKETKTVGKTLLERQDDGSWKVIYQEPTGIGVVSPYQTERARRTVEQVDKLMGKVSSKTVGYGAWLGIFPETDARNFKAELDTLVANITFSELTAMREASKTGGALGQISDREGKLLGSALGALDIYQSQEDFKANLQQIKDSINRWQQEVDKQSDWEYIPD